MTPVVDLPALQEALEQAAFAAFVASGEDRDVALEAVLAASLTAAAVLPGDSGLYGALSVILNAIAVEVTR